MADLLNDGNWKVSWVPAIANIAAPTTTELNAGVSLESQITPTGVSIVPTTADVDTSNLASTFTTGNAGRRSFVNEIEYKRQTGTDPAWNALYYQATGYLVVRRTVASGTGWASGQLVEVYPSQCGEPALAVPAMNEVQKVKVPMKMTADANTRAVIA